jgi:hypothetical protein
MRKPLREKEGRTGAVANGRRKEMSEKQIYQGQAYKGRSGI